MFYLDIHGTLRLLLRAVLLLLLFPQVSAGDELENRRAWAGLDMFPSLLAADSGIAEKKGQEGNLRLLLVYRDREDLAEEMSIHLERIGVIRDIPVRISIIRIDELKDNLDLAPAGIFLVNRAGNAIEAVIRFGREHQAIVFSPFAGDVERGVSSGMVITDRILPYVNLEAMRLSGIHIKPFFLRIAEKYGE
jgi:hypothetical protein